MRKLLLTLIAMPVTCTFAQIENQMIAHFPFDGNVNDVSNSSILGTNNACAFVQDRNGNLNSAISLNGTSSYINFISDSIKRPLPLSISAWVYVNTFNPNLATHVILSDNVYDDYFGYRLSIGTTGQITITLGGGLGSANPNNRRSFATNNSITSGEWHHIVAIIRNYNDMQVIVDCNDMPGQYSGTGPTTMVYSTSESTIGRDIGNASAPNGSYLDGSIDQLAIWERELTPSEITILCNTLNSLEIAEINSSESERVVLRIVDLMGRETEFKPNTSLIFIYSDGSTEKVFTVE